MRLLSIMAASVFCVLTGTGLSKPASAQAKPMAYAIVEVDASDRDGFLKDYLPKGFAAITGAGGRFIVRGGQIATIEGEAPKPRVLLVQFESLEKAKAAFATPEYAEARKIGDKYAKFRIFVVEGVPPQ